MKSRLSSTVWMLVIWVAVAAGGAALLAFYAGSHSNGAGLSDADGDTGFNPDEFVTDSVAGNDVAGEGGARSRVCNDL